MACFGIHHSPAAGMDSVSQMMWFLYLDLMFGILVFLHRVQQPRVLLWMTQMGMPRVFLTFPLWKLSFKVAPLRATRS